ncbi:MAG: hypothetical protein HMLKMBBP_00615 [Planctomycetes bacterium]|nr:hypothetical protein [Planctomycetota bacterium]
MSPDFAAASSAASARASRRRRYTASPSGGSAATRCETHSDIRRYAPSESSTSRDRSADARSARSFAAPAASPRASRSSALRSRATPCSVSTPWTTTPFAAATLVPRTPPPSPNAPPPPVRAAASAMTRTILMPRAYHPGRQPRPTLVRLLPDTCPTLARHLPDTCSRTPADARASPRECRRGTLRSNVTPSTRPCAAGSGTLCSAQRGPARGAARSARRSTRRSRNEDSSDEPEAAGGRPRQTGIVSWHTTGGSRK